MKQQVKQFKLIDLLIVVLIGTIIFVSIFTERENLLYFTVQSNLIVLISIFVDRNVKNKLVVNSLHLLALVCITITMIGSTIISDIVNVTIIAIIMHYVTPILFYVYSFFNRDLYKWNSKNLNIALLTVLIYLSLYILQYLTCLWLFDFNPYHVASWSLEQY